MFAKIYDALMADVDYEAICQWLKPHLRINDLVLDAGCGSGFLLVELMKNGYDTFGFDQDTAMLSLA
ncbi:MAG: class I SAM-dependent methyltransferase, partial [Acholeplasmataceae bacterium]|nr:class I SAM-dependent methyltransferase [Acholeplasmataceae bacterium]